jgi:hypothetical protein
MMKRSPAVWCQSRSHLQRSRVSLNVRPYRWGDRYRFHIVRSNELFSHSLGCEGLVGELRHFDLCLGSAGSKRSVGLRKSLWEQYIQA